MAEAVEKRKRRWLRWIVRGALVALVVAAVPAVLAFGTAAAWWREGRRLADDHAQFRVAHPGWSFPARVLSPAVPAEPPSDDLVLEAKARGYRAACRGLQPGDYCEANGKVVPRHGDVLEPLLLGWIMGPDGELREHLPLADAPKHLVDAILVAEDREFFQHSGVDLWALVRAAFTDVRDQKFKQGASTLTMQVVRTVVGHREKTVVRKLREAVMAASLDRRLGKQGVLQMYLDAPYLGQSGSLSVCGFAAAARHYFGKDARDLDLAEAATLAAILPAPGAMQPDRHPERAKERRDRVLRAMAHELGYDVTAALDEPVRTVPAAPLPERYPAYLSALRAELDARLPPERVRGGGLVVTAAINVAQQERTEGVLRDRTAQLQSLVGRRGETLQSAAVLLDNETGAVRALYGGAGLTSTGFNRATQAKRQPGSAFKPLVYALAFEKAGADGGPAFTASSIEPNAPRLFRTPQGDWSPRNVGGDYTPTASLAYALAWSQNIATASLLEELGGPGQLIDLARRAGFDVSAFPAEMGLALGQAEVTPLEMARFIAAVANGGLRTEGSTVLQAVDAQGREVLGAPHAGARILSPKAALLTRELMRLVIDYGTGGAARGVGEDLGYLGPAMGKTGTTDKERDAWFVGATPRQTGVVWLGYDVPQSLGAAASDLAAPLWGWWMRKVARPATPYPKFTEEPKLVRRDICTETGRLAAPGCRTLPAPFLPGTEPKTGCTAEHAPKAEGDEAPLHHISLWKKLEQERNGAPPVEAPTSPSATQ